MSDRVVVVMRVLKKELELLLDIIETRHAVQGHNSIMYGIKTQ